MKKRIISTILAALMALTTLVGGSIFAASADVVDKAMLIDDISVDDPSMTGRMGYIVNDSKDNDFGVKAWKSENPYTVRDLNGISVAFDLNVIAFSKCNHNVSDVAPNDFTHTQGLVFTFSNHEGWQGIIYDAVKQEFQIVNVGWPCSVVPVDGSHIVDRASFQMNPGEWHRVFYNIAGTEVSIFCDGEELLVHDFDGGPKNNLSRTFLMFWESHVRLMMDNLVVGTDEYDDNAKSNDGQILFKDDFNDAADVTLSHVEQVKVWEYEKDEKGEDKLFPVYEDDGKTPKLDGEGNQITEKHIKKDGSGNNIQATDEAGNPLTAPVYHFLKDGVDTTDPSQEHAGFVFGNGSAHDSPNVPCRGVDKATYCGSIKDVDGAAIFFADTVAIEGQTVNAAISVDSSKAAFTEAKDLLLSLDPIFTLKGFENVAAGAEISADENNMVSIKLPAGFSGKLADLVLEIPADKEMAQSCKYRYGFIATGATEFKNGASAVDAKKVTIDGGFTFTKNYLPGDANSDGKVNAKDVALIMRFNSVKAALRRKKGSTPTPEQQKILDSILLKAADVFPNDAEDPLDTVNAQDLSVLVEMLASKPLNTEWDVKPTSPVTISAPEVEIAHGAEEAEFDLIIENVPAVGISSCLVNIKIEGAQYKTVKKVDVGSGQWKVVSASDSATIVWVDTGNGVKKDITLAHVTVTLPSTLKWGAEIPIVVTADADPDNFFSADEVNGDHTGVGAVGVNGMIKVAPCIHALSHVAAVAATAKADGNIEHWKCDICGSLFSDKDGTNELAPEDVVVKFGDASGVAGDVNGDGALNAKDVTSVMKFLVGKTPAKWNESAADFNGDGKVNAKDVTSMMKAIVGK